MQSAVARRWLMAGVMASVWVWPLMGQSGGETPKGRVLAQVPAADDAVIARFEQRVSGYLDVVKQAGAPKDKAKQNIEALDQRRRELAARVKELRSAARQGDIFTPETAALFRRLIAKTMAGTNGPGIRASMRHAEPILSTEVRVNESYPNGKGVPLQSTPASLLLNLPELPKGVEYRVMDHALLLRDTEANIVVDILPDAFPK